MIGKFKSILSFIFFDFLALEILTFLTHQKNQANRLLCYENKKLKYPNISQYKKHIERSKNFRILFYTQEIIILI